MTRDERQTLGIKKWIAVNGCGSICYATGVGKTRTALKAVQILCKKRPILNVLVVVPTLFLKQQWLGLIMNAGLIQNCDVEVINTVIKKQWNTDFLIVDECHRMASDTFSALFNSVTYTFIMCLTATLERLDGKEIIIKKYAPVCDTITLSEALENKWVAPVKNYLVLLHVDLTKYKELNKKFNSYFAFFQWDFGVAMDALQNWKFRNKYAKEIGSTPKQVLAQAAQWMKALHARKDFIENHPKKIEVCRMILDARKDKKCITFCPTIKFAESIKRGITLHSGKKESENKKAIDDFNNATYGVLNSSKALNEGVDIKGLSVGIRMNINSSKITTTQTTGRICRFEPGKTAEMFTLVIADTQEIKWFANSNTSDYIVIDSEDKLNKVLNYDDVQSRQIQFNIDYNNRF